MSGRAAALLLLAAALALTPATTLAAIPDPAAGPAPACPFAGQTPKLFVQLFFGQSIPGRGLIGLRAWQRFVADTVTPALPSGFTVYDAYGQHMDRSTSVIGREPTKVVAVAETDSPDFRARVTGIADAYRRRFDQRSVGIVSNAGCGRF